MGRLWIFAKASVAMGELSVRMVVPMAMKKLQCLVLASGGIDLMAEEFRTQRWLPNRPCIGQGFAAFR